jgi:hypothetical protein
MTNLKFESIEDFLKFKDRCPFCSSELKVSLANFVLAPNTIPFLKCRLIDNKFEFSLKHTSHSFELAADVSINSQNNIVTFALTTPVVLEQYATDYMMAKTVFESMKPYIELYCSSRKCKMKYRLCSDIFACLKIEGVYSSFKIRPFPVYMESFVIEDFWIQNDWTTGLTNIYNKLKTECEPIRTNIINLETMGKDKIINRIKTLVTFS